MIKLVRKFCPFSDPAYLSAIADAALSSTGAIIEDDDIFHAITAIQDATVLATHCPICESFNACDRAKAPVENVRPLQSRNGDAFRLHAPTQKLRQQIVQR